MDRSHDEKPCGLAGTVAVAVRHAWRDEEEVAAAGLGPLAVVQHVEVSFEDVEALRHVLVEMRRCSGEVRRDADLGEGGVAGVFERGVNVDGAAHQGEVTPTEGCRCLEEVKSSARSARPHFPNRFN